MKTQEKQALDFIKAVIEQGENILENNTHSNHHDNYIAVNVKRYNDYIDIEQVFNEMELKWYDRKRVQEHFEESDINSIWDTWIDYEREYLWDIFNGVRNSSQSFYDELKDRILSRLPTHHPALEEITSKTQKLREVLKWEERDKAELAHQKLLDSQNMGFLGRSDGWFAICEASEIDLDDIKSCLEDYQYSSDEAEKQDYLDDAYCLADSLKPFLNALEWAIETVDTLNKNLSFKDEVIFRVNEKLEEINSDLSQVERLNFCVG